MRQDIQCEIITPVISKNMHHNNNYKFIDRLYILGFRGLLPCVSGLSTVLILVTSITCSQTTQFIYRATSSQILPAGRLSFLREQPLLSQVCHRGHLQINLHASCCVYVKSGKIKGIMWKKSMSLMDILVIDNGYIFNIQWIFLLQELP